MKRLSAALVFLLLGAGAAHALVPGQGVVVLYKDGARVAGVLVARTPGQVTVDMGGAQLTSNMADVRSIAAEKTAVERFNALLSAAGGDPVKLRAAADFARGHSLYTYYEALAERLGLPSDAPEVSVDPAAVAAAPAPAFSPEIAPDAHAPQPATLGFVSDDAVETASADAVVLGPPLRREHERENDPKDAARFLEKQAAAREARTHEVTNPVADMQFQLQQALDRSARGLPFGAP